MTTWRGGGGGGLGRGEELRRPLADPTSSEIADL